jgi:hypothetical protein
MVLVKVHTFKKKVALVAQACVFEEGEEVFKELTGLEVNAKQIERIGHEPLPN